MSFAADGQRLSRPPASVLDETFEAFVFDWEGTVVADLRADVVGVRQRIEAASAAGVHVFVVSGSGVGEVDRQLMARPWGPGRLHLCLNDGSEVFEVTSDGPMLVRQRTTTDDEERSLDRTAALTVSRLREHGVEAQVVGRPLGRRKVDLIPGVAWPDPRQDGLDELLDAVTARLRKGGIASLAEVVAVAADAARTAGLAEPRVTSDVKHVEIGLTDRSDSARWAAHWLAGRGITGGLVLVVADEFGPIGSLPGRDSFLVVSELARAAVVSVGAEPGGTLDGVLHLGGGPDQLAQLIDAQLLRRAERRVPSIDVDLAWVLRLPEEPVRERAAEALGALANGWAGTRGAREEDGPATSPLFVVNGVYTDQGAPRLLHGPLWTGLAIRRAHVQPHEELRLLDLRTGVLVRATDDIAQFRSMRFVSAANNGAVGIRAEARKPYLDPGEPLTEPRDAVGFERDCRGDVHLARTGDASGGGIAMAARDSVGRSGHLRVVERLAAWSANPTDVPGWDETVDRLTAMEAAGFDQLLGEHREAWARRWADAEVTIDGSADDELVARLAVFHLVSAAGEGGETAVGARGLTGEAYGGHVFWDADVFVQPVLTAIRPGAARAMLDYRIRRLPAARIAAAALGRRGARFPWESVTDGTDVTPRHVRGGHGELIAVRTGQREEHIVADIAWAAINYAAWSADAAFVAGAGRDLVVDTARYWASRLRRDHDGVGHVYGVMGPDEYHPIVDDNAFTNVMARWNLRRGADVLTHAGDRDEALAWRNLADGLVDGWDARLGLYEQFAGYWDLEPLLIAEIAPPPLAVDMLLGADRVAGSQLIKQADVLMLHHLVPDEVMAGSLAPCLAFYEPRCAHGSSLSPAIHASLFARAGQPDRALELFRLASRLDLDDLTGTTAGGVHLATMGGVWQALAYGFLGLRASGDSLNVDPCLPDNWNALGLRFRFRGQPVGVRATHDTVTVSCAVPLAVSVGPQAPTRCQPPGRTFPFDRSKP